MAHDGMAVVRARIVDGEPEITLIRNHECDVLSKVGLIDAPAVYDRRRGHLRGQRPASSRAATPGSSCAAAAGFGAAPALGGTLNNCAGGPTPGAPG